MTLSLASLSRRCRARARPTRAYALGAALALLAAAPRASAEDARPGSSATPALEARAHFERGVTFYTEADYAAALVEFRRAYELAPAWQVLFNVGQSHFQLRDYAKALTTLERFVAQGGDRIPADRRATVEGELAELANRVGHARIVCDLSGASIALDGEGLGEAPLGAPVLVGVGVHHVRATYAGRPPVERDVTVPAGETPQVTLVFGEAPAPAVVVERPAPLPVPAPHVTAVAAATPSRSRVPLIAAVGVAAAGATVGAVFGAMALHDKSRLDGECASKACAYGSQADIDAISRDATVSTAGFGVMAVSAAVGVAVWLASGSPPDDARRPGPVGTLFSGRF